MTTVVHEPIAQIIPEGTWAVDPVHSSVAFRVADLTQAFTFVNGRFTDVEGTIVVGADPGDVSLEGIIRVASVTTGQEQRDAHLRSPDFFDAERYPEIRFTSAEVVPGEGDALTIPGTLTLAGSEQEIELEGRVLGAGRGQSGERLVLEARGAISFGPTPVELVLDISASRAG
ncbi:MAG: YceI family protein [Gaiellaceae bacterium]